MGPAGKSVSGSSSGAECHFMIEAWRRAGRTGTQSTRSPGTSVTPKDGPPGAQPELAPAARTPGMAVRPDSSYRSSRIARVA